ncbi:hypothetical protein CIB48_g5266 [Xylaria polymorpha]|nr:hypothetical protein CIB48_g5266 [Xylaria polymorpha]
MHLKTIVATALLPLLAVADDTTLTSTMTMTKYITISRVATSSVYTNATSTFHAIGTGYSTFLPTTTAAEALDLLLPHLPPARRPSITARVAAPLL